MYGLILPFPSSCVFLVFVKVRTFRSGGRDCDAEKVGAFEKKNRNWGLDRESWKWKAGFFPGFPLRACEALWLTEGGTRGSTNGGGEFPSPLLLCESLQRKCCSSGNFLPLLQNCEWEESQQTQVTVCEAIHAIIIYPVMTCHANTPKQRAAVHHQLLELPESACFVEELCHG